MMVMRCPDAYATIILHAPIKVKNTQSLTLQMFSLVLSESIMYYRCVDRRPSGVI